PLPPRPRRELPTRNPIAPAPSRAAPPPNWASLVATALNGPDAPRVSWRLSIRVVPTSRNSLRQIHIPRPTLSAASAAPRTPAPHPPTPVASPPARAVPAALTPSPASSQSASPSATSPAHTTL